jgi:MOB kinase activator 1
MTSFIQTMFVQSSPPQYPHSPRPLPAIQGNVLVESESYLHLPLPLPLPGSPDSIHQSPLQKQIHTFFSADDASNSSLGSPHPSPVRRQEPRQQEAHRGLGYGFAHISTQADLLTRSNSNARNRQTFQSQKRAKGTTTWQLKQFADATLGGNSLRKCVQLPEGEDRSEWLAVNSMLHANAIGVSESSPN